MNRASISSDNGLSPGRRQAIIWTNAGGILLTGPLGINFSEISIEINKFSIKKMHLKMPSVKWRPFCPGGDELMGTWRHFCFTEARNYVLLWFCKVNLTISFWVKLQANTNNCCDNYNKSKHNKAVWTFHMKWYITVVRLMKPTAVGFIPYGHRRSDRIRTARFVW